MRKSLLKPVAVFTIGLLPFFFVLSACDSGGSNGGETVNNEFTLTIEPTSSNGSSASSKAWQEADPEEISGFTFFVDEENPETGEQVFGVYLSDEESFSEQSATDGLFGFLARSSGQPSTGSYSFTDDPSGIDEEDFSGVLYRDFSDFQSAPFYVIESGTIDVETSSNDEFAGSIDASGTRYTVTQSSVEQQPVSITGEFSAENVETFLSLETPGL